MDSAEGDIHNGIYTIISGSLKQISTFPYTSNPETAPNKMLNSNTPGTYIFSLNSYDLKGNSIHVSVTICCLPLIDNASNCESKVFQLACESIRRSGETVPASCN